MGLDITSFRGIKKVFGSIEDGEIFAPYDNPDFPGRAAGLEPGAIYSYEQQANFSAGSYSGYSRWREQLAELAGWGNYSSVQDAASGPFFELLWFADNEGTIGPVHSAKLAQDFAAFQSKADAHPDDYFREKYTAWRKAFEMAQDNGAVSFH